MGAWGHGLLQNDDAQDAFLGVMDDIEDNLKKLARRRPSDEMAGQLAGGVGLLLHLKSWCSFDEDRDFVPVLGGILTRYEPGFAGLPARAAEILREIKDGKGSDLVNRDGVLDKRLAIALFGEGKGFPMERGFGL